MMLYTLKALKDLGLTLNKRIWLIIGTAEEGVWTDMDTFKEEFIRVRFLRDLIRLQAMRNILQCRNI